MGEVREEIYLGDIKDRMRMGIYMGIQMGMGVVGMMIAKEIYIRRKLKIIKIKIM